MAQPSVLNYFNNRKRALHEDSKINVARKVLLLNSSDSNVSLSTKDTDKMVNVVEVPKVIMPPQNSYVQKLIKKPATPRTKKSKSTIKSGDIGALLNSMGKNSIPETITNQTNVKEIDHSKDVPIFESPKDKICNVQQPKTPTKTINALDKLNGAGNEPTIAQLKHKLSRSSRLAELKASLACLNQSEKKLEAAEEKTRSLKNFKSIELEINLSPTKPQSPQKSYLSPKKDTLPACRNLFNVQHPTKNALPLPSNPSKLIKTIDKESLTLPFKYRRIAEIFRSIDTVSQILFNRKETITFKKLKPSVEQMLKQNMTEKHLSQIKYIYPDSFMFQQEKLREFGAGTKQEKWELVLLPNIKVNTITSAALLERRRKLYSILIEKVKDYHDEFLSTLDPPIKVVRDDIKRWHPLFDIEKVPDIELSPLPLAPDQEEFTTGNQVLEKARTLFNCNTRMERALEKLKQSQETQTSQPDIQEESILKGIPKALLEKVRLRQAAKAFEAMTRSVGKEKEAQLYSRLPEIARLTRNLFVAEKKNVIPFDLVVEKISQSSRIFLTKNDIEMYLKTIAKEETEWIKLELVRGALFVKISKNYDISLVLNKLQSLADQKND